MKTSHSGYDAVMHEWEDVEVKPSPDVKTESNLAAADEDEWENV